MEPEISSRFDRTHLAVASSPIVTTIALASDGWGAIAKLKQCKLPARLNINFDNTMISSLKYTARFNLNLNKIFVLVGQIRVTPDS